MRSVRAAGDNCMGMATRPNDKEPFQVAGICPPFARARDEWYGLIGGEAMEENSGSLAVMGEDTANIEDHGTSRTPYTPASLVIHRYRSRRAGRGMRRPGDCLGARAWRGEVQCE